MSGPTSEDAARIATSMETTPELLPYLPELLQDLESLGATTEVIVDIARRAGVGAGDRILDVCCGKGTVTIALGARLGCRVHGIDLFAPFVERARQAAAEAGVADRCTFEKADAESRVRELAATGDPYDGVVMAAAGSVLGGYRETVASLREVVRPGGWILIEDGFVPAGFSNPVPVGYEHYLAHDDAIAQLTAHGDTLELEVVVPREDVAIFNARNTVLIAARAEEVARRHPATSHAVRAYAREQVAWSAAAEAMATAVWMLRRA